MISVQPRLLNLDEFMKMGSAGIFHEDEHIELIKGEIIKMSPIGSKHSSIVLKLNNFLQNQLARELLLSTQNPLVIMKEAYVEPDLVILNYREDYYADSHPSEKDVRLLIEVSDSSLQYDQLSKLPIYAEAKIEELWIINLISKEIEVYKHPEKNNYTKVERYKTGQLKSTSIAIELDVDFIFN